MRFLFILISLPLAVAALYRLWIFLLLQISRRPPLTLLTAVVVIRTIHAACRGLLYLVPRQWEHVHAYISTFAAATLWPSVSLGTFLDSLRQLEQCPTIKNGMANLNMQSLFEGFWRRDVIHKRNPEFISPLQRPVIFIPGIKAQAFYDADILPWLEEAVQQIPAITQEMFESMRNQRFSAYRNELGLTTHPFVKNFDSSVRKYDQDWNMFYFYKGSERVDENHTLCPLTSAFLDSIPGLEKTMVCFSALQPGVWIPPHCGLTNAIVRVHLPLITNSDCYIRVGNEIRQWHPNEPLLFDDSFEHEVWNRGKDVRVVLFINVIHPALSLDEQRALRSFLSNSLGQIPAVQAWRERQTG